jgi:hypothetical protein
MTSSAGTSRRLNWNPRCGRRWCLSAQVTTGTPIVGQKETRAAAVPTKTAFGSQLLRARIRVSKVSTSSRGAYTPGSTACRSPRRMSQRIGPTRSGCSRRAMTPSVASTAWISRWEVFTLSQGLKKGAGVNAWAILSFPEITLQAQAAGLASRMATTTRRRLACGSGAGDFPVPEVPFRRNGGG